MKNTLTAKKIGRNIGLSLFAQFISLITSFILGFIVPKFIDEYQYSYWQTFLLYINYVTLLQFGILDGIVLRYAQYDYDELDKPRVRSQLKLLLVVLSILAIGISAFSIVFLEGTVRYIVILVACSILTRNIFCYTSYTLQITNKINLYALVVIAQRAVYAGMVIILLVARNNDFYWYCIADLVADLFGVLLGVVFTRELYLGKSLSVPESLSEAKSNVSAGVFLTVASFSGWFIIAGAKSVIQWHWDTLTFGKLAFGFSVSMAFVTFVNAIGVVLFPSLKRMDEKDMPLVYGKIRNSFTLLIFCILLCYFPGCWILERWLPNYASSLVYLGILLPMITYYTRLSFLTNSYLKAYRKEKLMLIINLFSVGLGMVLFLLSAYCFNSIVLLLYSVVFAIMVRSVASEIVVSKIIHKKFYKEFALEFLMAIGFIVSVQFFSLWIGCAVYAAMLVVYLAINRKSLAVILQTVKDMLRKKEKQQ
ncbi:MAG: hypothetical protein ACI3XE_00100 [Eubacteriales bacterium]